MTSAVATGVFPAGLDEFGAIKGEPAHPLLAEYRPIPSLDSPAGRFPAGRDQPAQMDNVLFEIANESGAYSTDMTFGHQTKELARRGSMAILVMLLGLAATPRATPAETLPASRIPLLYCTDLFHPVHRE